MGTTDTPKGFRDVYWCWSLNEPVLITFDLKGEHMRCPGCDYECEGTKPDRGFRALHDFITHITKPTGPLESDKVAKELEEERKR